MSNKDFMELAIEVVRHYHNTHAELGNEHGCIAENDIYVVWVTKALQNNKALLATNCPDGMYYEFTWNGDKGEGYLDAYKKQENIVVKPESEEK